MNPFARLPFSLFIVCMVLLPACADQPEVDARETLVGRWVLDHAYRNGKPTESLDELYFEFYEDGQMKTNLTGQPSLAVYELDEGVIHQRESPIEADFTVESLTDSVLVLKTSLRNYAFRFHLRRQVEVE